MTIPSLPAGLDPALKALTHCLALTNDNYQRLLNQPESLPFCREAGRTLRVLADRMTQVLLAALAEPPESNEEDLLLEEEAETLEEESADE
ncbi:hypothetical protein [Methylosarcina fibrata]|uniref:hypothetical protein n=1 Tax=Methylosarcina fibrata TaxID=105972 RepID=UPI000378C8A3|nr:hypothetical protein [Methylosarcina fibrata]